MPALFVVDRKGTIVFSQYAKNMTDIPENQDLFKIPEGTSNWERPIDLVDQGKTECRNDWFPKMKKIGCALFWGWRDRWRMEGSLWGYRHWRYEGGKMLYIDRRPAPAWFGYPNSLIEDAFTQGTGPSGYLKDNLCWRWSSEIFAFLEAVFLYLAVTKSPWPVNAQSTIFIWVKWKGEMFFCSGQSWRPGRIRISHLPWIYPHPAPGVFHFLNIGFFINPTSSRRWWRKWLNPWQRRFSISPFPLGSKGERGNVKSSFT